MENIKQIDDWLDSAQLVCTKTDGKTKYNVNNFTFPLKFTNYKNLSSGSYTTGSKRWSTRVKNINKQAK